MELWIYLFLLSLVSILFFIFYVDMNPLIPTLIIVLSLSGLLLTFLSPLHLVTGYEEVTDNCTVGCEKVTTTTPITTELTFINYIFTLFFIMSFLVTSVLWSTDFRGSGRSDR